MKTLRFTLFLGLWLLTAIAGFAQRSNEQLGGVYYAYPVTVAEKAVFPDGFGVFYISHYGRHGSRWLPEEERYQWVNAQFADKSRLTPLGKSVRKRLKKVWANAKGNAGQLTPLGKQQHKAIARRMEQNYPEAFAGENAQVTAQSSTVNRCRVSMLSFCEALKDTCPWLKFTPETKPEFMAYLNHEPDSLKAVAKAITPRVKARTDGFIGRLFKNPAAVDQPAKLIGELQTIASDMQDVPLAIDLFDIFTREELQAVHDINNRRMFLCNGSAKENRGWAARASIPLWQDIVLRADSLIESGGHGASLRFGHDTALYRLLTLLQLSLPSQEMEDIIPMAANLQMVFARNAQGEVRVVFLHNEKLQYLPIPSENGSYLWSEVKQYMEQRINAL